MSGQYGPATRRRATDIVATGIPIGPRLDPCVCRAPRHEHSGKQRTGGVKGGTCKRYRADLAWDLAYRAIEASDLPIGVSLRRANKILRAQHYTQNPRKPGEWSIGASDTSTCPRKIQFRNKPPENFTPAREDTREADAGTMLHEGITARMRLIYPWREFAGKVRIPGLDRDSEFDSYDPIIAEVEDYKTAGRYRWDQVGNDGPSESVWEQAMLYGLALVDSGRPVRTVRISYFHREKGHDETFVRPYDEQVAKAALDRLLGYATALDLGIELPRTGTGPSNDELCRRCFAREVCWNITDAERLGRSPESLTILGAEPADEDVVWAVGEKVAASAERLAAQKREEATKGLLEGIEPGRYGDFEGYEKWGGGGDDRARFADTLADLFDLPDDQRPALADVPVPPKHRYSFIQWGKVRKATLERERKAKAALDQDGDS